VLEWAEYLSIYPAHFDVSEVQRAMQIASFGGGNVDDFIISGKSRSSGGIHDLTEEEINEIAGVS